MLPADFSGDVPRFGGTQSADQSALDAVGEAALACDDEYFDHVYAAWGSTSARAMPRRDTRAPTPQGGVLGKDVCCDRRTASQ